MRGSSSAATKPFITEGSSELSAKTNSRSARGLAMRSRIVREKQSCRLRDGTQIESLGLDRGNVSGIGQLEDTDGGCIHRRGVFDRGGRLGQCRRSQISLSLGTAVTNFPPQSVI
jgi:hypothetical protein